MQKLTSLLCALLIVLSASATPQFSGKRPSEVLKQMDQNQRIQFLRTKKAQSASHFIRATKAATPQPMRLQNKLVDEPAVPDTVIIFSCNATFYPEDGAVFYGLYTEDWSKSFYFSILVEEGKHDIENGRTYTLADMEESESNSWEDDEWESHPYASATFTKTVGAGYDVHILATVTDSLGNSFVVIYDEKPITISGDTVDVAFTDSIPNIEYISDGTWLFRAGGESFGYSVQLSYYSTNQLSCAGAYKGEDIDQNTSVIAEFYKDEAEETQVNFATVKDGDFVVLDTDTAFHLNGTLLGVLNDTAKVYRLNITSSKPQAKQQVTITADNLSVDDYWFDYTEEVKFLAYDETNEVEVVLYPEGLAEKMAGTYTIGLGGTRVTVRTADPMDDVETNAFSGSLELQYENGSILITGSVLCFDNTLYTLNLSYTKPAKSREQVLTFENVDLAVFDDNSWQVIGYNAEHTQYISLAAVPADFGETSGTYTEKELVADYCYVVTDITAGNLYKYFTVLEANLTMNYNAADSTALVTGTLLCLNSEDKTDVPEFTIAINATIPNPYEFDEAKADFNQQFATFTVDPEYADAGWLYVDAMDGNDKMLGLQFYVAEGDTLLGEGTYPINDSHEPGTVAASPGMTPNGQLRYSYAAIVDVAQRLINNAWFLVSGNVTITKEGVITVDALNTKGKKVYCVLGATQAISNVNTNAAATKRIVNGKLVIEKNGVRYDVLGSQL